MKIKIFNAELIKKNQDDVRIIHYAFYFTDSNNKESEGFANITITGSLLGNWILRFKSSNPVEFEKELIYFCLKVIQDELIEHVKSNLNDVPLKLIYSLKNAPSLNFSYDAIEDINGYEIEY